tara:strand:+ start:1187 stop:1399 length:213 start_codon:yes stop_codon:yes gene_type:complete
MIPGQGYLASNRLYSQLKRLPKEVEYKKALLPVRVVDVGQEGPTYSKIDKPERADFALQPAEYDAALNNH